MLPLPIVASLEAHQKYESLIEKKKASQDRNEQSPLNIRTNVEDGTTVGYDLHNIDLEGDMA